MKRTSMRKDPLRDGTLTSPAPFERTPPWNLETLPSACDSPWWMYSLWI